MLLPELGADEFESIPIVTGVTLLFFDVVPSAFIIFSLILYFLGHYLFDTAKRDLIAKQEDPGIDEDPSVGGSELLGIWIVGALNEEKTKWSRFQTFGVRVMLLSIGLFFLGNLMILLASLITILSVNLAKTTIDYILVLSTVFQSSVVISNLGVYVYQSKRALVDEEYRENMEFIKNSLNDEEDSE